MCEVADSSVFSQSGFANSRLRICISASVATMINFHNYTDICQLKLYLWTFFRFWNEQV